MYLSFLLLFLLFSLHIFSINPSNDFLNKQINENNNIENTIALQLSLSSNLKQQKQLNENKFFFNNWFKNKSLFKRKRHKTTIKNYVPIGIKTKVKNCFNCALFITTTVIDWKLDFLGNPEHSTGQELKSKIWKQKQMQKLQELMSKKSNSNNYYTDIRASLHDTRYMYDTLAPKNLLYNNNNLLSTLKNNNDGNPPTPVKGNKLSEITYCVNEQNRELALAIVSAVLGNDNIIVECK